MKPRAHLAIHAILFAGCVGLGVYAWKTRAQLHRAEHYAQSGIDSVTSICSAVLFELRLGAKQPGFFRVARVCIGDVDRGEAQQVVNEEVNLDTAAITARMEQRLKERALPYLTMDPVKTEFLPKGYRD